MGNKVFLGCNYNDKSVKSTFDNLKKSLEKEFPVELTIIDKQNGRHARDIWKNIKGKIEEASLTIFDVSAFRPNVVLELGYALATKEEAAVVISFRARKNKGKAPDWLLSDIGHLNRIQYKQVMELKKAISREIKQMKFMKKYAKAEKEYGGKEETKKHWEYLNKILFDIRDQVSKNKTQIKAILQGSNLKIDKFLELMLGTELFEEKNGRYVIKRDSDS